MSLLEIAKIQEARQKRELEVYKNVFAKVQYKIYIYASNGSKACVYKVPSFIFGFPLIDVPKTIEYIVAKLNHQGFVAMQLDHENIYINWDLSAKHRKEIREKERSKVNLEEEEKKDDLTSTLLKLRNMTS